MPQFISCHQQSGKSRKPYYIHLLWYHLTFHIQVSQQGAKGSICCRRFHLYTLPSTNAAQTTINAARGNITRISFSVFPKISQYTSDSFVTFAESPQRVLDNESSTAHVDKNWWGYYYLCQPPIFCLLLRVFVVQ